MSRSNIISTILGISLITFLIVGEIKCIVKAVKCNWEPVGKAEVIYTASSLLGIGAIVGWIDIDDK